MEPQKINTPRDFFLHVAAFASLYFLAITFVTLIFTLIDYKFPDTQLQYYYYDPYSGAVRFAIASLIVLTPIFVYLMRLIQKETKNNPERAKLGVRKWLTYITLFIAGATVVGDLIALLNSFLGGALATTFALKALTILAVAGAGFWYYILDLKGYWLAHSDRSHYAGYGLILAVLVGTIAGFYIMGSPMTQRDLRLDTERVNDLSMIQSQVVSYWQNNEKFPASLADLDDKANGYLIPVDPETGKSYEYRVTGNLSFELCATFNKETPREMNGEYYPEMSFIVDSGNWKHDAGHVCFDREINPALYTKPPVMMY